MSERLTDFPQRVALILNRGSGIGIEVLGWCNGEPSEFHNYTHNSILKAKDAEIEKQKLEYEALEGCVQNRLIDLGFGNYPTFSQAFDAIKDRIATLEKQLEGKIHDC